MAPFSGWGSTALRLPNHFEEAVYFLPLSSQIFLVLILSTLEGLKTASTLEPRSGFEQGTPGLGIQRLNHFLRMFGFFLENILVHYLTSSYTRLVNPCFYRCY